MSYALTDRSVNTGDMFKGIGGDHGSMTCSSESILFLVSTKSGWHLRACRGFRLTDTTHRYRVFSYFFSSHALFSPSNAARVARSRWSKTKVDTVKALRRAGKRTFFVTNNSSKSRRQYCIKLEGFGVQGVGVEDIVTSGSAIAGEQACKDCGPSFVFIVPPPLNFHPNRAFHRGSSWDFVFFKPFPTADSLPTNLSFLRRGQEPS